MIDFNEFKYSHSFDKSSSKEQKDIICLCIDITESSICSLKDILENKAKYSPSKKNNVIHKLKSSLILICSHEINKYIDSLLSGSHIRKNDIENLIEMIIIANKELNDVKEIL